jgi:hypothetical protein
MTTHIDFLRSGIAIIPVRYKDKRPDAKLLPAGPDGSPTWEPYKTTLPSEADLQHWFARPENYGVVTGWKGLLVLDFDDASEYSKWRLWASKRGGIARLVAETAFQVQTSRGVHVYVRSTTPGANRKLGKIDIKYRGYVLGPGSIHPTGIEYRALKDALIFPLIENLSDILPAELLVQPTTVATQPVTVLSSDPWQSAMNVAPQVKAGAVEKIKQSLRIQDFFSDLRPTSRDGRWFMTICPFHDDHHPSFWIDTQQQICGCHKHCIDKPLDAINLFARLHGLDNSEAIRILVQQYLEQR